MLCFDVRLQVGLISATEDTVLALVRLLPRVGPHVLFQLGRMAEPFPTLHTNMREVFAMDHKQVSIKQPLLRGLIVAIFALLQFRLLVP